MRKAKLSPYQYKLAKEDAELKAQMDKSSSIKDL